MHSPPIEWAILGAHFIALDVIRDRGEPDGDTASEVIRETYAVGSRRLHWDAGRRGAAVPSAYL